MGDGRVNGESSFRLKCSVVPPHPGTQTWKHHGHRSPAVSLSTGNCPIRQPTHLLWNVNIDSSILLAELCFFLKKKIGIIFHAILNICGGFAWVSIGFHTVQLWSVEYFFLWYVNWTTHIISFSLCSSLWDYFSLFLNKEDDTQSN